MTTFHRSLQFNNQSDLNRKCGEITFCIQVDKRVYALNCIYCSQIFLQWDLFIHHMEQEHDGQLNMHSALHIEDDLRDEDSEKSERNTSSMFNKHNESDSFSYNDPLEDENSINSISFEKSIKLEKEDSATNLSINDKMNAIEKDIDKNNDLITEQEDNCNDNILSDDISSTNSSNDDNSQANNFVYNKRQFTELVIKYYKEYPVLWQLNRIDYKNIKKQQEAYKMITKLVNKEMNSKLKCLQIKGKINKLKSEFRKEHERINGLYDATEMVENESSMKLTTSFYEKMSFLKDYISDGRKRSKRGSKALTNVKEYLPLAKHTLEENQQFIELYKNYPCLWNVNHIGFRFKNQRQESLQELLETVNEQLKLNLTSEDLQKQLYCIRYAVTQEKHRQIECEKFNIEFIPQCKLHNELLFLNDSVGPFKCEYCEDIFNGPDQYKVHKSSHDGSMPYTCPQCNKGFMKIGNCTVHLRRHTKDFQFECHECGKKFPTSTDLNVHTRHHTGEKPYFCDICGQSFRTWTYFDSHRKRHEKNPTHKCSICSKSFYEHNKLKQHMKSHMNIRDKVCNVCGKSFTCSKYLNQHKLTHAVNKKYSCQICDKRFAQYGGLSNHLKSHKTITNNADTNDNIQ